MKKFFKGLSFSQILAGTLAAVTSFLLAAKIGLAGSVIGVAVGSAVSAIATQLYQNVLKASTKKIKDVTPFPVTHEQTVSDDGHPSAPESTGGESAAARGDDDHDENDRDVKDTEPVTTVMDPAQKTHVGRVVRGDARSSAGARTVRSFHAAPRPSEQSQAHHRRAAIIVAVVSALLAVMVTAGVILLATRGEGTDTVVRDIVNKPSVTPSPEPTGSDGENGDNTGEQSSPTPTPTQSTDQNTTSPGTGNPSPTDTTTPSPTTNPSGGTDTGTSGTGGTGGNGGGGNGSTDQPTSTPSPTPTTTGTASSSSR